MKIERAKFILQKIFLNCKGMGSSASSKGVRNYLVIAGHNEPRWIVPDKALFGHHVLEQWRPYGLFSQIAWMIWRLLYSVGGGGFLPGTKILTTNAVGELIIPGNSLSVVPVIYVGSPGLQQKAVVTLVDQSNGQPLAVMKVALEDGARASVKREANTLKSLAQMGVKNVPGLIAEDEEHGRSWQTIISGRLTRSKLTQGHIDFLLKLPTPKKTTTLDKQKDILRGLTESIETDLSIEQLDIIKEAIEQVGGEKNIPLVLVHGDFAPWNLKRQPNNQLAAIDWEDSELEGLPLWDLCHFYYIQVHLLHSNKRLKTFMLDQLIEGYLQGLGISQSDKNLLVLLYLLGTALQNNCNKSREFRDFLIKQVPLVLAK